MIVNAKQWVLNKEPTPGLPFNFEINTQNSTFKLIRKELNSDDLKDNQILVETKYLSNDPAQKFWIATADKAYAAGVKKGDPIQARGIGKVLASKNEKFKVGDFITGRVCWTTHIIIDDIPKNELYKIDTSNGELWWHLSVLGGTSLTSYFIFYRYLKMKETEENYGKVALISGAAGAVGSTCIQIALNVFKASKVVAIAGGPEKVKYVESFGDKVIGVDYKDPNFKENLAKAVGGANTVDYFIDNVGGDILDYCVNFSKPNTKVIAVGSISGYNDPEKFAFKNYGAVITKRLNVRGILLYDNYEQFSQAFAKLNEMISKNQLNVEDSATICDALNEKFVSVPDIWNGLFSGINKGKLITRVSSSDS
ncbi:hypothetical protein KAFR_0C03710 [Kazachstania africana CBS 2517]|uniref:Enoyl reductase (ER) domain-containing protein n=1 Tax=Kazachstania africana (strain ATCC 22294 / BCRC 22015 / CBS 2517 / CECT 1963 / NBRC 1671 / NRRL Y-8276) TaxID=1071382 RepID=H2ASL3_KAZAF|nr:hypothetical protein KAFR_0C03710 [Kazachstania africana CBS 2517]CCF57363.1 hypothetical protein KAFR_0C03710 [Kazachstania africana CBS 2517]